jgi:hypothetical protein
MNRKTNTTWRVLPHGPVEELGEDLRRVEGDLEGMALKRVMTLARREGGGVVVHNAIALEDEAMKRIEAWGPVEAIVVPSGFHRLDAPAFKARYPNARVYCPAGARKEVEKAVRVDGTYDDFPRDRAVSLVTLEGTAQQEGVMVVRPVGHLSSHPPDPQMPGGTTLVFNDAIFNLPHLPGVDGFIFRYVTGSTGGPRVTRLMRWLVVKDAERLRAHLERLAETPELVRVIVSHGRMVEGDAAGVIRTAAASMA